jgi:hypothetical protein
MHHARHLVLTASPQYTVCFKSGVYDSIVPLLFVSSKR